MRCSLDKEFQLYIPGYKGLNMQEVAVLQEQITTRRDDEIGSS